MAKRKKLPDKLRAWIEARKRFHLSHAQVQMARELGMNPKKLGGKANHDQEPWKMPLPQFIEHLYSRRFGRERPEVVLSIEDIARRQEQKKAARREAKEPRRAAEGSADPNLPAPENARRIDVTLTELKKLDDTPPWEWPERTATFLLDVLRDRGATEEERVLAAELAGNSVVVNDELVGALLSILRSGEELEGVRARAAISLGPVLELCDTDGFDDPDSAPVAERTFREIQESMRRLYLDAAVPKEVRRRILEASVRAPLDWHRSATRAAFASDDEEWRLTAVFCMQHVRGFDKQILASLESTNPDIHLEAVRAAGTWEIGAAWPHVLGLVTAGDTERHLLFEAIQAVGAIRPQEAYEVLAHLEDSDDPEIAEAVLEATSMAGGDWDEDDEDLDVDEEPAAPN